MSWLRKFPWLSLLLVVLSYSVIGWYAAQSSEDLSKWLVAKGHSWGWVLEEETTVGFIQLSEIVIICLVSLLLTIPVAAITGLVGSGLKSDTRAFIAMLGWSVAIVLIIRWLHYFVHLLVLLCATILGRLDLQRVGYNEWQVAGILTSCCVGGFALGWLIFAYELSILGNP